MHKSLNSLNFPEYRTYLLTEINIRWLLGKLPPIQVLRQQTLGEWCRPFGVQGVVLNYENIPDIIPERPLWHRGILASTVISISSVTVYS